MQFAIYARVARRSDGSEDRIEAQLAHVRSYLDERWPDAPEPLVFSDEGRSAMQPAAGRPGFEAMLEAIEAGEVEAVAVSSLDRLTRDAGQFGLLLVYLDELGVALVVTEGQR